MKVRAAREYIQHQMNLLVGRDTLFHQFEKGAKFLAAVFGQTAAYHFAGGDIQRRKETGRSPARPPPYSPPPPRPWRK